MKQSCIIMTFPGPCESFLYFNYLSTVSSPHSMLIFVFTDRFGNRNDFRRHKPLLCNVIFLFTSSVVPFQVFKTINAICISAVRSFAVIEVIPSKRTKPQLLELRGRIQLQCLSLNKQTGKVDVVTPFAKSNCVDVVQICTDAAGEGLGCGLFEEPFGFLTELCSLGHPLPVRAYFCHSLCNMSKLDEHC